MLFLVLSALLRASMTEVPPDVWHCRNQVEVWCAADGCAAAAAEEFTPMDIYAGASDLSVCAYTGCWEAQVEPMSAEGRLLWVVDRAPFSTSMDGGGAADVTLLIVARDGVGFVRVGGLATPLLCTRAPAANLEAE